MVVAHRYKRFRWCLDVVTAYKDLQREKIALEESLKALSLSRSHVTECETSTSSQSEKEALTASDLQAADSSISSELSDSLVIVLTILLLCMNTQTSFFTSLLQVCLGEPVTLIRHPMNMIPTTWDWAPERPNVRPEWTWTLW